MNFNRVPSPEVKLQVQPANKRMPIQPLYRDVRAGCPKAGLPHPVRDVVYEQVHKQTHLGPDLHRHNWCVQGERKLKNPGLSIV